MSNHGNHTFRSAILTGLLTMALAAPQVNAQTGRCESNLFMPNFCEPHGGPCNCDYTQSEKRFECDPNALPGACHGPPNGPAFFPGDTDVLVWIDITNVWPTDPLQTLDPRECGIGIRACSSR